MGWDLEAFFEFDQYDMKETMSKHVPKQQGFAQIIFTMAPPPTPMAYAEVGLAFSTLVTTPGVLAPPPMGLAPGTLPASSLPLCRGEGCWSPVHCPPCTNRTKSQWLHEREGSSVNHLIQHRTTVSAI